MDAAAPVQRREGFIQQQQIRLGQQGPGQCHPLTLTAGKAVGRLPQQLGKAKTRSQILWLPAPPPLASRQLQVAEHTQVGEETSILKHQPDAPRLGGQGCKLAPLPAQGIARGPVEPGDDTQQGALATARRTEQAEDAAGGQRQIARQGEGSEITSGLEVEVHPNSLRCRRCSTP